jgi:hypothetical protein
MRLHRSCRRRSTQFGCNDFPRLFLSKAFQFGNIVRGPTFYASHETYSIQTNLKFGILGKFQAPLRGQTISTIGTPLAFKTIGLGMAARRASPARLKPGRRYQRLGGPPGVCSSTPVRSPTARGGVCLRIGPCRLQAPVSAGCLTGFVFASTLATRGLA